MNPDDSPLVRQARLLLLLDVSADTTPEGLDGERLAVYDFLAAHPLLLVGAGDPELLTLRLAGFDDRAVGYASPAHRFVTARQRLSADLAALVRRGLLDVSASGRIRYRLTGEGSRIARAFTAMYAQTYVTAARVVVRRLRRLSDRRLRERLRQSWVPPDHHPLLQSDDPLLPDHPPRHDGTPERRPGAPAGVFRRSPEETA